MNSNIHIAQKKEVHLFHEVTGVEQSLVQYIVATVEDDYLADICNHKMNSINNILAAVITHLQ